MLQTGEQHWEPIEEDSELLKSELSLTVFDWEKWWVMNLTGRGNLVIAEAYSPHTVDPTKGRPIVYLDQNHWSTIAQVMVDPDLVKKKSEIEPARELIQFASDGGVIIPLSAANMSETAALYGDKRYEIGVSMGSLSNGWMMRHPLSVRRLEFTRLFAQEFDIDHQINTSRPVFTLEPFAVFDSEPDAGALSPTDIKLFELAQTSPSVLLDVLLEPTRVDPKPPEGWVAVNQQVTDYLRDSDLSNRQKQNYSYLYTWADHAGSIQETLAALELSLSDIKNLYAAEIPRLIKSMKMIGIYGRMAMKRHTNPDSKWRGNDLNDMIYLSCAAAYADFVAAEKRTAEDLRQVNKSLDVQNNVFPSIHSLVDALKSAGIQTETDRQKNSTAAAPQAD